MWRTRVFNEDLPTVLRWWSSRDVVTRDVRLKHLARREALDRDGHRALHHMYPRGRVTARDAIVIGRHHVLLQDFEQMGHVRRLGIALGRRKRNRPAVDSG